ncbi:hypothetical protein FQZ97_920390 [compost metagenome]
MMFVMGNGKCPLPRAIDDRCLELGDGRKHGQHGHGLLPQLDACAGNDFRPVLFLGKVLFLGEAPRDLEELGEFPPPFIREIFRHAFGNIARGNRISLPGEGGPTKACGQRLVDCLDFLNQKAVLDGIGEGRLVSIGPAALADLFDFGETRHSFFRKRGN